MSHPGAARPPHSIRIMEKTIRALTVWVPVIAEKKQVPNSPYWPNACEHDGYCFSFNLPWAAHEVNAKYDVYTWRDMSKSGHSEQMCIRYGSKGYEYLSAGSVQRLLSDYRAGNEMNTATSVAIALFIEHFKDTHKMPFHNGVEERTPNTAHYV